MSEPETATTVERSEFGAGVVVCLAKFSEHLGTAQERTINQLAGLIRGTTAIERLGKEAAWKLDFEKRYRREHGWSKHPKATSEEVALSDSIEMWANAASDHFYDLDEARAPKPLRELAELTLRMGHGFEDTLWTVDDFDRVRVLWRESCLAVDEQLGAAPDWGEW